MDRPVRSYQIRYKTLWIANQICRTRTGLGYRFVFTKKIKRKNSELQIQILYDVYDNYASVWTGWPFFVCVQFAYTTSEPGVDGQASKINLLQDLIKKRCNYQILLFTDMDIIWPIPEYPCLSNT